MCSVKLVNILEALSNALAEVIPRLMIRQLLRAMHVLKRILPAPRDVTNGCFFYLRIHGSCLLDPGLCSKSW